MRRRAVYAAGLGGFVLAVVAGLVAYAPPGAPARAAEAYGCQGSAVSMDGAGGKLDAVSAPGEGGTYDDPFLVDLDGTVVWEGRTDQVIKTGTWTVSIGGFPISGDVDNPDGKKGTGGTESVADRVPEPVQFLLEGNQLVTVSGSVEGSGSSCSATVWIKMAGSPAFTPMWFAGIGLFLFALLVFVWMAFGTISLPQGEQIMTQAAVRALDQPVDPGAGR